MTEAKGRFPALSGFCRCSQDLPEKGKKAEKGRKEAEKRRFPGRKSSQTPLKPPICYTNTLPFEVSFHD